MSIQSASSVARYPLDDLVGALRRMSVYAGERLAFSYLSASNEDWIRISYAELDREARAVAVSLQERGLGGKRVVLAMGSGIEYVIAFLGCVFAGCVAVPLFPPRGSKRNERVDSVLRDSEPAAAIMRREHLLRAGCAHDGIWIEGTLALEFEQLTQGDAKAWRGPWRGDNPVFLQYTSASTGSPKGVMVSAGNLLHNFQVLSDFLEVREGESSAVFWLPPHHDAGLIGGILHPLYEGFSSTLMSPVAFASRPVSWLEAISNTRATIAGAPDSAFEACITHSTPEDIEGLDLSSWECAMNGAEPIRAETLRRFAERFARCGFRAESFRCTYGLAESTLGVSFEKGQGQPNVKVVETGAFELGEVKEAEGDGLCVVASGQVNPRHDVRIVDPATCRECSANRVGEIWISSPSVAQGYWGRALESAETFGAFLADSAEGPFLRTGDLGWIEGRDLFVAGRRKDLLIVHGRNIHPQDVEDSVRKAHPALAGGRGAAFAVLRDGRERVVLVHEASTVSPEELLEACHATQSAAAGSHQVALWDIVLIRTGTLPVTTSGKIRRSEARRIYEAGELRSLVCYRDAVGEDNSVPEAETDFETLILRLLARELQTEPGKIDRRKPLALYGLDSVQAVRLVAELGRNTGRVLTPTLVYDYPTVEALARFLESGGPEAEETERVPLAMPVAVVGVGCNLPGSPGVDAFWKLLDSGGDAISEAPADRWNTDALYDPTPGRAGKMYSRSGGFIEGCDEFDAAFFGISPREASAMDPQQRLLVDATWSALEHAGIPPEQIAGRNVGVFIGISSVDYSHLSFSGDKTISAIDAYSATGNAHSIAANRLSYLLDLRGPSLAVDTACSSSLVALHLACQSLESGESEAAIVGGVNLLLSPRMTVAFCQAHMLSPDERCKTFDESADGYVRGEGCGVAILKPLASAIRDGDQILGVLRGTAVNQDGRTNGISAPSRSAQRAVIERALARAGVSPAQVDFVEAHGTGTRLGDAIELEALMDVFGPTTEEAGPCHVGSVKTNIGHLEPAAGMASLLKVLLSLKNEKIPSHLHLRQLNSHVDWEGSRMRVNAEPLAWERQERPRIATLSGFGFGGTNAHVVVEEAPLARPSLEARIGRPMHVMTLSAKTESALRRMAGDQAGQLKSTTDDVADICYARNAGRTAMPHALAVVSGSAMGMAEQLAAYAEGQTGHGVIEGFRARTAPEVAFLFTGQGSQRAGMGKDLYAAFEPFRSAIDECAALVGDRLDAPLGFFLDDGEDAIRRLGDTRYAQPSLFAVEYAMARQWRAWGIRPAVVQGHSIGDFAAAVTAGALSLEDALYLVCERARMMADLPSGGSMLAVFAGPGAVEDLVAEHADVAVAAYNGPLATVISGGQASLEAIEERLADRNLRSRRMVVSHAFHSPLMEPMLDEFERIARTVAHRPLTLPMVSDLDGRLIPPGETLGAEYWRDQIRQPVRFADGTQALLAAGYDVFVELGPTPNLTTMAKGIEGASAATWLPSMGAGEDERRTLLQTVGSLFTRGISPDWRAVDGRENPRKVAVPTYPFERERFWFKSGDAEVGSSGKPSGHPYLGRRLETSETIYEASVTEEWPSSVADHRIMGGVILPAAAMADMFAAAVGGSAAIEIQNLELAKVLPVDEGQRRRAQVTANETGSMKLVSRATGSEEWALHASATGGATDRTAGRMDLEEARARCATPLAPVALYRGYRENGFEFGPAYQTIQDVSVGEGYAVSRLGRAEGVAPDPGSAIDVQLFDGCLQTVAAAIMGSRGSTTGRLLPVSFERITVYGPLEGSINCVVRLRADSYRPQTILSDFSACDEEGRVLVEVTGFALQDLSQAEEPSSSVYEVHWVERAPIQNDTDAPRENWVVLGTNDGWAGELSEELRRRGRLVTVASELPRDLPPNGRVGIVDTRPGDAGDDPLQVQPALETLRLLAGVGGSERFRVWSVVRNASAVEAGQAVAVGQAAFVGIHRVACLEMPFVPTTLLDIDEPNPARVADEVLAEDPEQQVAWRGETRSVPRIRAAEFDECPDTAEGPWALEPVTAGTIDGLARRPVRRFAPEAGQVEVAVRAAGLNFRDVLKTLGLYPTQSGDASLLGDECSGVVSALGEGVTDLKVGDKVIAIGRRCFGSHMRTLAPFVVRKPEGLRDEEAATLMIAFTTALYGLRDLARVRPGERVLIHSAAGGVGLAAIQIARWLGAEVYATAGSDRKREHLHALGIEHVFDSRSTQFLPDVLAVTDGQGVDVVLNSLSGAAIEAGLSALRSGGRFVEIGKRDIYQNSKLPMFPFRNNLSFLALDMDRIASEEEGKMRALMMDVVEGVERGDFRALDATLFPIEEAADAFRYLSQARNIGKVVLTMDGDAGASTDSVVRGDGAYVISGGLGAVGLALADWLVSRGAKKLVLFGRSKPSAEARDAVAWMRLKGADVQVAAVDVTDLPQVEAVLKKHGPIRGIVHASGVLRDALIPNVGEEDYRAVAEPKIRGAWNLHQASRDLELDFFVMLSSAASALGSPGQASYAAANAVLDALAWQRRAEGKPGLAINYGPWAGMGMAAGNVSARGFGIRDLACEDALEAFGSALRRDATQAVVLALDLDAMAKVAASGLRLSMLEELLPSAGESQKRSSGSSSFADELRECPPEDQHAMVVTLIQTELARVQQSQPDRIDVEVPIRSLGFDSLMALELKNRIEKELRLEIPVADLIEGPSVNELAKRVVSLVVRA